MRTNTRKTIKGNEDKNSQIGSVESPRPAHVREFYAINDCVRVRRTDETNSKHDELIAECRGWKWAQHIAEVLNATKGN